MSLLGFKNTDCVLQDWKNDLISFLSQMRVFRLEKSSTIYRLQASQLISVYFRFYSFTTIHTASELYGVAPCGAYSSFPKRRAALLPNRAQQTLCAWTYFPSWSNIGEFQFFGVKGNIWTCPHVIQSHTFLLRLKQHVCHKYEDEKS